jgi:hypothetical protein
MNISVCIQYSAYSYGILEFVFTRYINALRLKSSIKLLLKFKKMKRLKYLAVPFQLHKL